MELETIVNRISRAELDLQPDFQRGEIWDRRRQQRLIDSILRGWYVPAVHIVLSDSGDIVLDGQQRLAAIRDFFDDAFPVDGHFDPPRPDIEEIHGLRFSKLPPAIQRKLNRFALPVVTLKNFEPQEPNELFFRLNQSYNLTPPEKRNALHGPARDQIKKLVSSFESFGLLNINAVGFSNGRLAYDDIIARTCLAVERRDLGQHINNNVVEEFYRSATFSDSTLDGVEAAGGELLAQISDCDARVRFNKGTMFTWLVFLFWYPRVTGAPTPRYFLREFESDRLRLKQGSRDLSTSQPEWIFDAVTIYDDRASYRVTDVTSVLLRDLVLQLYVQTRYTGPSVRGSDRLIGQIGNSPTAPMQNVLLEFASTSEWGTVLGTTVDGDES